MAKPIAKLIHHFYCSGYLGCSLFTLTNDWGRRWQYRGHSKNLNRRKQLLTWDQIRRRYGSLDWHYLVCMDTRALAGQGPLHSSYSWGHYTAEGARACHPLCVGTDIKDGLGGLLVSGFGHSYMFLYLLAVPPGFLCESSSSLLNLQALACSFLWSKFLSFPLSLQYSPSLRSAECHCSSISLPGGLPTRQA